MPNKTKSRDGLSVAVEGNLRLYDIAYCILDSIGYTNNCNVQQKNYTGAATMKKRKQVKHTCYTCGGERD